MHWKRNRCVCFPRCCALGVLPLTTSASAHLHTDEQWQSRKRNREERRVAGREGEREGEDKWRERGHAEAEAVRIKRESSLRSAIRLWSEGSELQRLCCGELQHSLILLINAAAFSHQCALILLLQTHFQSSAQRYYIMWRLEKKISCHFQRKHRTSWCTN